MTNDISEMPIEEINLNFVRKLEAAGLQNLNVILYLDHWPLPSPTLLQVAIYNWDEDLFDHLVSQKVDLNLSFKNGTALHLAVDRCGPNLNIARKLISLGVPINMRDSVMHWSPLHVACYQGKLEIAELLIDSGADINITNIYNVENPKINLGITPLHLAVKANQIAMINLMCRKRANINAESLKYGTPLLYAIKLNKTEIVKLLIQWGADVNMLSKYCKVKSNMLHYNPIEVVHLTALHLAVIKSRELMVSILLLNPATNVNAGQLTALHYAVKFDFANLNELLAAGADINVRTPDNRTIIGYCLDVWAGDREKRERICRLLVAHATKLSLIGFNVDPDIIVDSNSTIAERCRLELERMRTTNIWDRPITVDKAFGCIHTLSLLLNTKESGRLLANRFKEEFRLYGSIIQWRVVKMFYRRRLLSGKGYDIVFRFLYSIVFQELLSQEFIAGLLSYLTYNDLNEIIRTCTKLR